MRLDLPEALKAQYSSAYGRYTYAVLNAERQVLFSSRPDGGAVFPNDPRTSAIIYLETSLGDRTTAGVSVRETPQGQPIWIQVGEDLSHRDVIVDDIVAEFFTRVAWITIPVLILLLVADVLIFRNAVAPLIGASREAARITPARIEQRLSTHNLPREIQPLVAGINAALDRLEQGFARQREFTETVAHELRTPLTILRTRIEMLSDSAGAALRKDIESMSRVVTQLLEAAEVETLNPMPGEVADLHAAAGEVAEALGPLAIAEGKSLALTGSEQPVWVIGNAELLQRAVRNLVENALAYTAEGTEVEIDIGEQGTLHVLDRGLGVPHDARDLIFKRFWRGDRKRAGGAGLGLSIVRRIVETAGGTISVQDRTDGGADFAVRFVKVATPTAAP